MELAKVEIERSMERIESLEIENKYCQLIFDKELRQYIGVKMVFPKTVA